MISLLMMYINNIIIQFLIWWWDKYIYSIFNRYELPTSSKGIEWGLPRNWWLNDDVQLQYESAPDLHEYACLLPDMGGKMMLT